MVLNYVVYNTIKKKSVLTSPCASRARREFYVATILITIVILFGACHILKCFINMLELVSVLTGKPILKLNIELIIIHLENKLKQTWGNNMNLVVSLSHLLITFNCSANFSIYCYKVGIAFEASIFLFAFRTTSSEPHFLGF
jgi:hypothetical protein